jgi:[ribosomal protein S18]-alanine N-acetyltransferase
MPIAPPLNQFHVRLALLADLHAISIIEDDSFPTPYPPVLFERLLDECSESFFVATNQEGKLVGYCVCSLNGESAHLISIAVQSDYRRRGVATKLLHRAMEFLIEARIVELRLEVNPRNVDAARLYSKLGFETIEVLEGYYSDGGDAIRMRLTMGEPAKSVDSSSSRRD